MQAALVYVSINFEWLPCNCKHSRPVHTIPKIFEKGVYTLKTYQMFSVQTSLEKFENATIIGHFGFVFEENRATKSRDYHDVIVLVKLHL